MQLLRSPLDAILGSTSKVRVLRVLCRREMGLTARELSRLTETSRPAIAGAISDLEALGVITIEDIGKQYVCRINRVHGLVQAALMPLFTAERAMIDEFYADVRATMESFKPMGVWIFGSAARGEMRPGSDVDVFVLVRRESDVEKLEDRLLDERSNWSKKYGFTVNGIVMTEPAVVAQGKAGSPFIQNILEDARMVLGEIPRSLSARKEFHGSPGRKQATR